MSTITIDTPSRLEWFDSHCHLNELENPASIWQDAQRHRIGQCLIPGTEPSQWSGVLQYQSDTCLAAIGVHPWFVRDLSEQLFQLAAAVNEYSVSAIGEIGLDFHFGKHVRPAVDQQIDAFRQQLQFAQKYDLPVIIHCVKAHQQVIQLLKQYPVKGVIHAFIGSPQLAQQYLDLGLFLGIGPPRPY